MSYSSLSFTSLMMAASILNILLNRRHLLLSLLSLEIMILALVLTISLYSLIFSCLETLCLLVILTLGACEASLGLACLVLMTRSTGNDYVSCLNFNKC